MKGLLLPRAGGFFSFSSSSCTTTEGDPSESCCSFSFSSSTSSSFSVSLLCAGLSECSSVICESSPLTLERPRATSSSIASSDERARKTSPSPPGGEAGVEGDEEEEEEEGASDGHEGVGAPEELGSGEEGRVVSLINTHLSSAAATDGVEEAEGDSCRMCMSSLITGRTNSLDSIDRAISENSELTRDKRTISVVLKKGPTAKAHKSPLRSLILSSSSSAGIASSWSSSLPEETETNEAQEESSTTMWSSSLQLRITEVKWPADPQTLDQQDEDLQLRERDALSQSVSVSVSQ
mmetsp:Transcript_12719/g.24795  ORF Transcript_12719/g.24795 Transcript_12719/m.24795 type:complete len:294 (+) Transcript_12719:721-1602(+)